MNARVESYRLVASHGRHIRMATKVIFSDGREVKFLDKLSKADAIRQAMRQLERETIR